LTNYLIYLWIFEKIKKEAIKINGVLKIKKILTQYLGTKIQVEIDIEVDQKLLVKDANMIELNIKKSVEKIENINNCFVHIQANKK